MITAVLDISKKANIADFCKDLDNIIGAMTFGKLTKALTKNTATPYTKVTADERQFKAALAASGICDTAFRFKTAFRHRQKIAKEV